MASSSSLSPIVISSGSDSEGELLLPEKKVFTPTKNLVYVESDDDTPSDDDVTLSDDDDVLPAKKRLRFDVEVRCLQDDPQFPIYDSPVNGYPMHALIDILLKPDIPEERICTVQPLSVTENAAFVVDVERVEFDDLKADDLGSWKGTGTKRTYFRFLSCGSIRFTTTKPNPSAISKYFILTRRYFIHNTYNKFHRLIADICDHEGHQNKYVMLQYWFDGPSIEIKIKPHGNSKSSTPFFRTSESAKKKHREIAATNTPRETIHIATQMSGGEIEAKGLLHLPRNAQQIKNYRRSGHKKDGNILYSVMLQCKLAEGTSDAFVRDVKAAPEPQCVLFFDWQLHDLVRLLTDSEVFSILTADTTYNLGEFYVTPTTYKHFMLRDVTTNKQPIMAGPIFVHMRKTFSSFNYFANTLISYEKKLQDIRAFGTDGDPALIEAFSHNFPCARQLRCFIHMKKNIASKLKDNGLPPSVSQEFISDIFGKHIGGTYEEGLVDSTDAIDFDSRLQNCRDIWNTREKAYERQGQVSFFDYFSQYCASSVCHTMLSGVRKAVGLGCPPEIFTTNASESLNAALKKKVNHKETEWPEFNEAMKQYVVSQREETIRSISGRGQYRLAKEYAHVLVSPQAWVKMTPEQQKIALKRFDNLRAKNIKLPVPSCSLLPNDEASTSKQMSVSANESGITLLPMATIDAMWEKAEEYLLAGNNVVTAPSDKMVTSRTGMTPHFVRIISPGHYVCDKQCLQWSSSHIS